MRRFTRFLILPTLWGCTPLDAPKHGPLNLGFERPVDTSTDTADTGDWPMPIPTISGVDAGAGFGAALAYDAQILYIGAPHGLSGTVYQFDGSEHEPVLTGAGRVGAHLAATAEGLWIGAPLAENGAGTVLRLDGSLVGAGLGGVGIALTSGPPAVFAHGSGWEAADGQTGTTPARPTALAVADTIVGAGMAWGPDALHSASGVWPRPQPEDEAGFALVAGDFDSDGDPDWAVGAPGTDSVHLVDAASLETWGVLQGTGRVGHSLAVCLGSPADGLLIGAPRAGAGWTGAVHWYANPSDSTPTKRWDGPSTGSALGTAVACDGDQLALGAPGSGDAHGMVLLPIPSGAGSSGAAPSAR